MTTSTDRVVVKVGGSVLRSPTDLQVIIERIKSMSMSPVVVVSAANGITDRLLAAAEEAEAGTVDIDGFVENLRRHHLVLAGPFGEADAALVDDLEPVLTGLATELVSIAEAGVLTASSRDAVLAVGERCSARLLATSLEHSGAETVFHDADELGIITDGVHGRATVAVTQTTGQVRPPLERNLSSGTIPVITGYFGRGPADEITTLGRGGSDYSAAIVACCLSADRLEIWKDVDGFLTADPAKVTGARVVPSMSYEEAAELAYLGVQVLHPRTLEPVSNAGIPVIVTGYRGRGATGTHIGPAHAVPDRLRALGASEGFGIVSMHGSAMAYEPGVGERVFEALAEADINVVNMAASQASFALLVDASEAATAAALLESMSIPTVESVGYEVGYALMCVVGQNIKRRPGIAGRIFSAIGDAGINVDMISVGSSNVALSFVVDEADITTAMQVLHDSLPVGGQPAEPAAGPRQSTGG